MNCLCGAELIWGGDHTFEDYGIDGEGIVSNLSCPSCNNYVLLYQPEP
jgi:hypothetical protein